MEKSKLDALDNNNGNFNVVRFIKLNKIKKFPYYFIQIINNENSQLNKKDPHYHYYKLNQLLKREDIDIPLNYMNLKDLKGNQIKKLCEIIGISEEELLNSEYLISNEQGEFICFSEKSKFNNFDSVKTFLTGINKINSVDELKELIYNLTEETITVIANSSNQKSIANQILKTIVSDNGNKFNMNTYNFLQSKIDQKKFEISDDELIVFLNKENYKIDKNMLDFFQKINNYKFKINNIELSFEKYYPNLERFYKYNQKITEEEKLNFTNSIENNYFLIENNNENISNYNLEDDYLISIRIRFIDKNVNYNCELVSAFLKSLILINNINPKEIENEDEKEMDLRDWQLLIKGTSYTDNIDKAIYNKIKYFNYRNKVLILYLNQTNLLLNPNIKFVDLKKELIEMIEKLKKEFHEIKFLITSNPNVFNLFNLIQNEKENISVRFLDYSKYVNFNNNDTEKFTIINLDRQADLNEKIKDHNRNLIFNFKTNFSDFESNLNFQNLKDFINESIKIEDPNFNRNNINSKLKPFLECVEISNNPFDQFKKNIQNLNSENFKKEILEEKNYKNLILLTNSECNGCQKIESLLNEFLEEEKLKRGFKIYRYNTMNENIHFKKYRQVPAFVLFENGKITKEIDMKKVIQENENHDAAIKDVLSELFNKHYL